MSGHFVAGRVFLGGFLFSLSLGFACRTAGLSVLWLLTGFPRIGWHLAQSISNVRAVSPSTVMRTFIASSGSSCAIFSGHSTRQRSPE